MTEEDKKTLNSTDIESYKKMIDCLCNERN